MAGIQPTDLIKWGFFLAGLFLVFIIIVQMLVSTTSLENLTSVFGTGNTGYNVLTLGVMAFGLLIVAFILIKRITNR